LVRAFVAIVSEVRLQPLMTIGTRRVVLEVDGVGCVGTHGGFR